MLCHPWIAAVLVVATTSVASPAWGDSTRAREPKMWVWFTDRHIPDAASLDARLARAATALSPHAAARRAKVMGARPVDELDLPVHQAYLARIEALGAEVVHVSRWLNAASVRAPGASLPAIEALPFVREITPVATGRSNRRERDAALPPAAGQPPAPRDSDPVAGASFNYGPSYGQMAEIGVVAAHDLGLSGAGVIVAMHDTGFYRDHEAYQPLLAAGRLLAQHDFINDDGETQNEPGDDPGQHRHGTSTWALVGGFKQGQLIGAAYGASFLLAKTEDVTSETPIEEDNWVAAMEWSDSLGADIISSSLSYIDFHTYSQMNGDTTPITIAADIAASRGIVVCTAAGNWATQDWYYIGAPADGDSVIAVGATTPSGGMWDDSSHGPTFDGRIKPELVARGDGTYTAVVPGGAFGDTSSYREESGTSVSTPLVAGAAALLLEAKPTLTPIQVRETLKLTADNASTPDNHRGWGRINVMAAITLAASSVPGAAGAPVATPTLVAQPNPFRDETRLSLATAPGIGVEVFTVDGRCVRVLSARPADGAVIWDGRDAGGRQLSPGLYLMRSRSSGTPAAGSGTSAAGKVVLRR